MSVVGGLLVDKDAFNTMEAVHFGRVKACFGVVNSILKLRALVKGETRGL